MKALVLQEYNHFEYLNVPDPEVGPEDVLIEVKACGICGSDVHGMDGSTRRRVPPVIMGHEAAGVIAAVGAGVHGWHTGDRVTFDSTIYCGRCFFCLRGATNLCDNRRVLGVSCGEYRQDGAFADYVVVPQHILYRLPEDLSFEHATMVEALSVALHAVGRTPLTLNDTAMVVGSGMIGLLVIQTLRVAGCGYIFAADLDRSRLALARSLGADEVLDPQCDDVVERVRQRTSGRGADATFEVVGMTPTVRVATECARKGGTVTLVGNVSPTTDFPLQSTVTRELTLYGSCGSRGEYPACLDLIARGRIQVAPMISAIAPVSEGAKWFHRLYQREPGLMKVVLRPSGT